MSQDRARGSLKRGGLPFAELISEEMKRQSLSFATVADRIRAASLDEKERSGVTRQLVSRWTQGSVIPHRDHVRWLAHALGLPVERLAFAADAQRNGLSTSETGSLTTSSIEVLPNYARAGHINHTPQIDDVVLAAEESAQFVRRAGMRVNDIALEQIEAEVRLLASRYLSEPPATLFQPLVRLRGEVFAVLRTQQPTRYLNRLYISAAQLCALLAHMSCDFNYPEVAATHARTAWLCADLCGHDALRAHVRWIQAQIAYWQSDYRRSAEIVQSGWEFATDQTSRLRLASEEARALAAAGESSQVERALAVASAALNTDADSTGMGGAFNFPPGKAAYYAAEVYISLGGLNNLRRAASMATDSLEVFAGGQPDDTCPEFVAAAQLDLATAHLGLHSLDGAAHYLHPVLTMPPERRTHQLVRRLTRIKAALNAPVYMSLPPARQIHEQIDLFCNTSAARRLLQGMTSGGRDQEELWPSR